MKNTIAIDPGSEDSIHEGVQQICYSATNGYRNLLEAVGVAALAEAENAHANGSPKAAEYSRIAKGLEALLVTKPAQPKPTSFAITVEKMPGESQGSPDEWIFIATANVPWTTINGKYSDFGEVNLIEGADGAFGTYVDGYDVNIDPVLKSAMMAATEAAKHMDSLGRLRPAPMSA